MKSRKFAIYLNHKEVPFWTFKDKEEALFRKLFPGTEYRICHTGDAFYEALKWADTAFTWSLSDHRPWPEKARVQHIVTPAAGMDYFTFPPGVKGHNSHFHGPVMAQTLMGMILMENRGLAEALSNQGDKIWSRLKLVPYMQNLKGSRGLILGFGNIGRSFGQILKPLGIHLTGLSRSLKERPSYFTENDVVDTLDNLDHHLGQADHVILVMPRNKESDNLGDQNFFRKMKASGVLYNLGRGNALDEVALERALREGQIRAAYLDVFQEEPLSSQSPLWEVPQCYIYPHSSAMYPEYLEDFLREWEKRWLQGELDIRE